MKVYFRLTSTILFGLLSIFSAQAQDALEFVYFDFGKYYLTNEARNRLDEISARFSPDDSLQIEIFGHADSVGNDESNIDLSQKRCYSVWEYLDAKPNLSVRKAAISMSGEHFPILPNEINTNRNKNRRVLIMITLWHPDEMPKSSTGVVYHGGTKGSEETTGVASGAETQPKSLMPAKSNPIASSETPKSNNTPSKPKIEPLKESPASFPNTNVLAEQEAQRIATEKIEKAKKMIRKGLAIEDIMEFTDLDRNTIEQLAIEVGKGR